MSEEKADKFLQLISRSKRGKLKVYLGYSPGVGKTYQMLQEAHRLKTQGVDVIVGYIEPHGRVETERLMEGLEVLPRIKTEYHGIKLEELDVDAVLARKPEVVLIDELAHTNVPGSRNPKRYQDVQDILAARIHVITSLNIQHLESLYDTVEKLIHIKVRERLPDAVLADADQIVNIDLSVEDLEKRMQEGRIYPKERITTALSNFFVPENLEQLRELTLRELASQIEHKLRDNPEEETFTTPDQVMVSLSSKGPDSPALIRYASRLAGKLNRNWYAVYVQTPTDKNVHTEKSTQQIFSDNLTLANELGATVFTYKGEDVVRTVLNFAKEYGIGHIVVGRSRPLPFWKRWIGSKTIVEELIEKSQGISIIVADVLSTPETEKPQPQPET